MLTKMYRLTSAKAGPPQIMRAHFHPRERASSCWLRQEMRKVGFETPFMRTTGGCGSNPLACVGFSPVPAWVGSGETWTPDADPAESPAADQAAGLEIPALISAAAIFCCWVR